ncbi:cytochrome P450 [Sporormia fimetaria CBS 119925]|uniref:Cytochrome P450 n=1 Tax=Sporormia fimetaria CBS 119925 TaxID=1340428 RepID=A0A6A6V8F7_9PLEO|nr:cytochrome P450 [Sporormia fimetaria CBS 119925]
MGSPAFEHVPGFTYLPSVEHNFSHNFSSAQSFPISLREETSSWQDLPNVKTIAAVVAFIFVVFHYNILEFLFSFNARRQGQGKVPPLVPHRLPFFGNVPLSYLWNARDFVVSSRYAFSSKHPVRVKLAFQEFYILQGAKNITALFKQQALSAFAVHGTLLRTVFSLPESAAQVYYKDDSGEHEKPHADSKVQPHNRVDFLTRSSFHKFLTGPGLAPLNRRFERNITERTSSLKPNQGWSRVPDLMEFFQNDVTAAVVDAMCGTHLLEANPGFLEDFWAIDHNVMTLFTRASRFFASQAEAARDRALAAVKNWHQWARYNFDPDSVGPDGDDPYWGTKFFRDRQNMFLGMDGFNADAVASQELAFLWGANTNSIISAFWVAVECFRDSALLVKIREEVGSCIVLEDGGARRFDIPKLLRQTMLQAVFAETLRLRVNGFLVRRPMRSDLKINDWVLKKDRFCLTSSTPAHMDADFWCQGPNKDHPVDQFYPDRFLKPNKEGDLEFSLKGTEGSWMPFGGGTHICPGKTFAKQVIFLTAALLVTQYDIEFVGDKEDMKMGTRNFGFGTLGPRGKVPVMIRRRVGF